jgi:NAD(P)-dependent dehydrogenase (short-subunit alcohol dehydrogenase family)
MTGATSGIGRIAAAKLAAAGMRLVLVARDRRRAEETLAQLNAACAGEAHRLHYADLSRLAEVKRVGAEIAALEPKIDVLVNNAGNIYGRREVTEDGLERTFATNHAAPFVLTRVLLDRVLAAAPARIVNTASDAHRKHLLDFDDLQMRRGYGGLKAYGHSKLCNILFTRALAKRLAGTGVTANCLHPGFVRTKLGQRDGSLLGIVVGIGMLFAGRPERGADTIVQLATAPGLIHDSGGYFYDCRPHTPTPAALDDASAERLWQETGRLTGVTW